MSCSSFSNEDLLFNYLDNFNVFLIHLSRGHVMKVSLWVIVMSFI